MRPRTRDNGPVKSWTGFPDTTDKETTDPESAPVTPEVAPLPPPRPPPKSAVARYRANDPSLPFTALLEVSDHAGLRSTHPFVHPRMLLGRTGDNDLSFNDPNVSTRHCELAAEQGHLVVRDLGSANGTFVNDKRVSEARLETGDLVRIGKTQVQVQVRDRRRLVKAVMSGKLWLSLLALVATAGVLSALAMRQKAAVRDQELQRRYESLVKTAVDKTVCARPAALDGLRDLDAAIGSRSVAIEMVGEHVRATPRGRENNLSLLELWRRKQKLYAAAATAVLDRQQAERDAIEKISRAGNRLASAKDRKISFWIDSLLTERLRSTEPLVAGLRERELRTGDFVSLVERLAVRGDATAVPELGSFQLGPDASELFAKCEAEQARASSGILGALNGLEE